MSSQRRALVLEDVADHQEKAKLLLPGWNIRFMPRIYDAVGELDRDPAYDLLIVDAELPDGHGSRFLEEVRKRNARVPVFLYSAHDRDGTSFSARDVDAFGALGFIYKGDLQDARGLEREAAEIQEKYTREMRERCTPHVDDEFGTLECVLVHSPSVEIECIDPQRSAEYLFDGGAPDLVKAQRQHEKFVRHLRRESNGAAVLEVELLLHDIVSAASGEGRRSILEQTLLPPELLRQRASLAEHTRISHTPALDDLLDALARMEPDVIVRAILCGISVTDFEGRPGRRDASGLHARLDAQVVTPVPNLYFTRDPVFVLGGTVFLSKMHWDVRRREPAIFRQIFNLHPYMERARERLVDLDEISGAFSIEGGDCMAISEGVYAVAESERTSRRAVKEVCRKLFEHGIAKRVLQPSIPVRRSFIHLDTVCSLVGRNHVLVHPQAVNAYQDTLEWTPETLEKDGEPEAKGLPFHRVLEREFGKEILQTADGDPMAGYEQWNDATNAFMVTPETAIAYDRNRKTNQRLKKEVRVATFAGDDLVLGRGGPRCMTMPLRRT